MIRIHLPSVSSPPILPPSSNFVRLIPQTLPHSVSTSTLSPISCHIDDRKHTSDLTSDFTLFPNFFTYAECRTLLAAALWKLDQNDNLRRRLARRRRRSQATEIEPLSSSSSSFHSPSKESTSKQKIESGSNANVQAALQDMFEGDYGFELGHFDSVIHHYRENLITALPPNPTLPTLLQRLHALFPGAFATNPPQSLSHDRKTQLTGFTPGSTTHALHLAPQGEILPHVDNVEASGGSIIGCSLGASRILRLERKGCSDSEKVECGGYDILLPSGSVYIQSGRVRYEYAHSILPYSHEASQWDGERLEVGHRVSLMLRDAKR